MGAGATVLGQTSGSWDKVSKVFTVPSGVDHAQVTCAQWDGQSQYVDQIYLNTSEDSF